MVRNGRCLQRISGESPSQSGGTSGTTLAHRGAGLRQKRLTLVLPQGSPMVQEKPGRPWTHPQQQTLCWLFSATAHSPVKGNLCIPLPWQIASLIPSLVAQMVKNLPAVQETWVQSLDQEDPPEKGMATHSSILARKIVWTEEPGRLQSMGSQRVRHD